VALELTLAPDANSEQSLVAAALDARTRAQARYSGFKVGAALETDDGAVIVGCNVENATYGLTLCAERVALVKALSDGRTRFTRIAIVADTSDPTPPCGACRQLLWEYCGDVDVILANLERVTARLKLASLLPMPFDGRLLE
jgi:cytidine deaminase